MSARLLLARVLPFFLLSGALGAATLIGDYLLHRHDLVWIGRYLGIPGVLVIAASLTYSLRKRRRISWGKPTKLLFWHQLGGWFGSLLVLLHSGIHFNSVLPWLATVAMGINVLSGMVGSILLTSSRRLVSERRKELQQRGLSADEIEAQLLWDSAAVRVMNQWRSVHIPIFIVFATLAVAHIVGTLVFWGWR